MGSNETPIDFTMDMAPAAPVFNLAELRRERERRHGAPPPDAAAPALTRALLLGEAGGGRRLDGIAVEAEVVADAAMFKTTIFVGGLTGPGGQRPGVVPTDALEVDCRQWGIEVVVTGNIGRLQAGPGHLKDLKPSNESSKRLVLDFLRRDAEMIYQSVMRGEQAVWVHCAQGINRGPSGLLAFLLLYTDATWEQACRLVKAVRPRARTQNNTFALQLQSLQPILPKLSLIPYSTLDIVDGAGGYGDESD
ncbi:hypothetical protein T492DRAFT_1095133 [Pavlovales sp. CCMP2436]|nr:hypothetical protein T492DRAFT_1095133 [Pavlovales sp. CCMP2436]